MTIEALFYFAALAVAGVVAGLIGGLFGVGGGIVLVPVLLHLLNVFGTPPEVAAHVAIGTSLSTIMATSWRSLSTHAKAGAVDWDVLKSWGPWIVFGAVCGALVAGLVSAATLLSVFGLGLLALAANMAFARDTWRLGAAMPTGALRAGFAGAIGALSAMMGIGGGAFGVSVMTLFGASIHRAVATASGFGALIAVPATLSYIVTGWGKAGLPAFSLGYVNAPGFVLLALLSMMSAPIGARLAHRLDRVVLKRAFAAFLAVTAASVLWRVWAR
jgi:uncharacterized membrane protein YfcA